MKYIISAMVVYYDTVEAISEEEAIDIFCAECPYDIDANTIECEGNIDDEWEQLVEPQESEESDADSD